MSSHLTNTVSGLSQCIILLHSLPYFFFTYLPESQIKKNFLFIQTNSSTIFQLYRGGHFLAEETVVPGENHRHVASIDIRD